MRVNGVRNQSFGMNPSDVIRKGLAGELAKGRNLDEFMGLIKELYPYRFMTAITDGDKFFWVGATRRFENKPNMTTYIKVDGKESVLRPVIREKYCTEAMYNYDKKDHDRLLAKYPSRSVIEDKGNEFETFFKDVKGKLFSEIVDPIAAKLKAIKDGYNPKEKAYLRIANTFPEYKDIPDIGEVRNIARGEARDANWMHIPMSI